MSLFNSKNFCLSSFLPCNANKIYYCIQCVIHFMFVHSVISLSLRSPRTLAFHTPHLPLPCLLFTVLLHCAIFWYTGHELMTTPDENCQDEFSGQLPCVIVTKTAFFSHTSQHTITTTCMLLHSVCTFMHH